MRLVPREDGMMRWCGRLNGSMICRQVAGFNLMRKLGSRDAVCREKCKNCTTTPN